MLAVLVLGWGAGAFAQEESASLEIGGLVVDETMTKVGRDFYDVYYSAWLTDERLQFIDLSSFMVTVSEKPMPNIGTQVSVSINDYLIYQSFVKPRYEEVEQAADYALQMTLSFISNYNQMEKDLDNGDMSGSGIF